MNTYKMLYEKTHKYITAYETDLTKHDRQWIEENPDTPYIHITRDYGTHMISLNNEDDYPKNNEVVPYLFGHADKEYILKEKMHALEYFHKNGYCIIHYGNGNTVKEITIKEAERILSEYTNVLLRKWQKENIYA